MQDIARDPAETDPTTAAAPILAFIAALPFRRTGPLVAALAAVLLAAPFLYLVFFAPSLFVTGPTMEVLALWLDARAIVDDPPSLAIAAEALADGSFLYLMLVNAGTAIGGTPGEALLVARGLMALIMIVPLAYGAAMRLPILPALMVTVFVVLTLLAPASGALGAQGACSVAVFLWLSLITYARPHRIVLTCAQTEGFFAGLALWFLYMTATPLFLAAFAGFIAALVMQERRGMVFTMMALAILLVLGASAELLSYMTVEHGLLLTRLEQIGGDVPMGSFGLQHMLALLAIPLGLLIRRQGGLVQFLFLAMLVVGGGAAMLAFGADLLPLLLIACLLAIFSRKSAEDRVLSKGAEHPALAGIMALSLIPFLLAGADISRASEALLVQFQKAPLAATADLGFSFGDEPYYADLILSRKVDASVARGFDLTPADQAVLMKEGLTLAERFAAERKLVGLVSAGNLSSLSTITLQELGAAQIVVTPTLAIDRLTDEARMSSQGILYAEYRKANRRDQLSPAYDIWIRRAN